MAVFNNPLHYGAATKAFHWIAVALFAFQFVSAGVMTQLAPGQAAVGLGVDSWYNWHKSLGLVALVIAILRLANRQAGSLPDWSPALGETARRAVHWLERALYLAMFAMPLSGFVFVMAGGYGVEFADRFTLPDPIGENETLAAIAQAVHAVSGWVLALSIAGHLWLVLRHPGLLRRMIPGAR